MPGDTASSLACIREILERLDSCSVKQNRQPIRKPPNMRANQQLILKPANDPSVGSRAVVQGDWVETLPERKYQ
jgi:hypothetical protein